MVKPLTMHEVLSLVRDPDETATTTGKGMPMNSSADGLASNGGTATTGLLRAVIPAAGMGTRFLPATKATPKEMLPVVDKPAIQYVVEEAADAGITNLLMITGRNKRPLEDHFDRNYELESILHRNGDEGRLASVQHPTDLANLHYVRQGDPKGLGHAVLCAADHVGQNPFAVMLGDDLIDARDKLLRRMIEVHLATGRSVIALMEVPLEQVHLYGCAAIEAVPEELVIPDTDVTSAEEVVAVTGLVEKPATADAPSNLIIIGRYVLTPKVFEVLEHTAPGRGGEIQLTDALAELITTDPDDGGGVLGVVFRGRRYDTGDRLEYLKTVITLAADREDLAEPLLAWLKDFTAEH
jgi:UTP--glucose-1-phosphate uridylyltransferase